MLHSAEMKLGYTPDSMQKLSIVCKFGTHAINVALGLKCLLSESISWHDVEEGLKPEREYGKYALQHLEAYPEIYSRIPYEIFTRHFYFPRSMMS